MFFQLPQKPSQTTCTQTQTHTRTHAWTDNLTDGKTKGDAAQPQPGPSAGRPTQVLCRLLPLQLQQDSTRDNQQRQRLRRLRLRLELLLLLPRTQSCVSSFFFFHRVFLFNPVSSTLLARPFVRSRPFYPPSRRFHRVQGKLKIQKVKGASSEVDSARVKDTQQSARERACERERERV